MSDPLVNLVAERFKAFAGSYITDGEDAFAYRLKIDHTLRVLDIAERLCRDADLGAETTQASRLAAILHDVGRFPQYQRYRTFRDADSANHAALSVVHTLREGLLDRAPSPVRRLVLGAVYLHNKRFLPPLRSPALHTVARVLRDSDKLDIYSVMIAHFSQENPKHPEVALSVVDEPDRYTPSVLDSVLKRQHGDYRLIVYANDFKLMTIGWLYDLNFGASARMLQEKGYLDTLIDWLPKNEHISTLRRQVHEDLARKAEGA